MNTEFEKGMEKIKRILSSVEDGYILEDNVLTILNPTVLNLIVLSDELKTGEEYQLFFDNDYQGVLVVASDAFYDDGNVKRSVDLNYAKPFEELDSSIKRLKVNNLN